MVINISGRTDIVAFYTPWLLNRIKEGYFDVRNPFNKKLISRINYEDVDIIVFCTKNPIPIVNHINEFNKPIQFQVTITPYKNDIEPNVPDKLKIIEAVKSISKQIGKENMSVRYDPIFISEKYNLEYHKKAFKKLCRHLNGYIDKFIISFIDDYKNVRNNYKYIKFIDFTKEDYKEIGEFFSKVAHENNIKVQTCFEEENLIEYGFDKGDCLSHELAFKLTGKTFKPWKARGKGNCNCVEMVDIGVYNTCKHLCKYCYANYSEKDIENNIKNHDPNSLLLISHIENDDIIKVRK